ncbi:hypothetical protein DPV78_003827 [Talaromyces pinophilus]|nr:hypothetical protein DPV78_003827 [Talaromyces pinophilus]
MTNLPLGELQIGLSAALSIETLSVLEGSANRARSNGKVFVVTVSQIKSSRLAIATDKRMQSVV